MERCKRDFYVFLVRNLRFSRPSCTFSTWETYGSASGNVEYGSRFVSLCRWILLFLCGDVNRWGKLKILKQKSIDNHQIINAFYQSGWLDSNQRPHAPQSYPFISYIFISNCFSVYLPTNKKRKYWYYLYLIH